MCDSRNNIIMRTCKCVTVKWSVHLDEVTEVTWKQCWKSFL